MIARQVVARIGCAARSFPRCISRNLRRPHLQRFVRVASCPWSGNFHAPAHCACKVASGGVSYLRACVQQH